MRKAYLFIISLLITNLCSAQSADVTKKLKQLQAAHKIPAILVSTQSADSKPEFYKIGSSGLENQPLSVQSHMKIASISKLFVGNLILKLHDLGKLNIDKPINHYLEKMVIAGEIPTIPNGDQITLRQLANHTSGLPDAIRDKKFQETINEFPSKLWTTEEILIYAFTQEPFFVPGAGFQYSNTNTILLALAAEQATKTPYSELLDKYILAPLNLESTGITKGVNLPEPSTTGFRNGKKDYLIGYGDFTFDATKWSASWTGAAGNLHSTLEDLTLAAPALIQGSLVSDKSKKIMREFHPTKTENWSYGFGLESWDGFIGHRGDVPGYQSLVAYHSKSKTTYVILTNLSNTDDGKSPAAEILNALTQ